MKKIFLLFFTAFSFSTLIIKAQTNCILNGDFSQGWTYWYNNIAGGAQLGIGTCGAPSSPYYVWFGDAAEQTGVDNMSYDIYQDIFIPYSNVSDVTLTYKTSINTLDGTTYDYDHFSLDLEDQAGNYLTGLGYFSNMNADNGIPGCQTWNSWGQPISSQYWGSNFRLHLKSYTDPSNPTIFRIDDVAINVNYYCSFGLSTNTYYTADGSENSYNASDIYTGLQQTGCSWNASVTAGNSWLTCNSSGFGDGNIDISVTENPTTSSRSGTIDVAGQSLFISQSGSSCAYTLSSPVFNCPDAAGNIYTNVALVNTFIGCTWNATVTSGSSWVTTSSNGIASGAITLYVLANTSGSARIATIDVNGETFTVNQPAGFPQGINELGNSQFSVSPNPTSGDLSIQLTGNTKNAAFSIYNLLGQNVLSGHLTNETTIFNLENLSDGVYYLSLDGNIKHPVKIIKD